MIRRSLRWLYGQWQQAQFDALMRQSEAECRKHAAEWAAKREGGKT